MLRSDTKIQLLTPTELLDIYGTPTLNDIERREYFTLNKNEIKLLKNFRNTEESVYFAICLIFFKMKRTLVNFSYQDTTEERRHIMERYFPSGLPPRSLPKNRSTILRIENKVLKLCNYSRFTDIVSKRIKLELKQLVSSNPRQRKLCKAFLDLLTKHRIAIPGYSTIQSIVSDISSSGSDQIIKAYVRYTTKSQREMILSLLDKTDKHSRIVSIRRDMKDL